jgi:hypothetical protein
MLQADMALKGALNDVAIPYWADPSQSISLTGNEARFAYYKGIDSNYLTVNIDEGGHVLVMNSGGKLLRLDFRDAVVSMEPLRQNGFTTGVILSVSDPSGHLPVYKMILIPERLPLI